MSTPTPLTVTVAILVSDLLHRCKSKDCRTDHGVAHWQIDQLVKSLEADAPGLLDQVKENDRKRRAYERARGKGRS